LLCNLPNLSVQAAVNGRGLENRVLGLQRRGEVYRNAIEVDLELIVGK